MEILLVYQSMELSCPLIFACFFLSDCGWVSYDSSHFFNYLLAFYIECSTSSITVAITFFAFVKTKSSRFENLFIMVFSAFEILFRGKVCLCLRIFSTSLSTASMNVLMIWQFFVVPSLMLSISDVVLLFFFILFPSLCSIKL